jgi:hypothetical protein
MCSISVNSGIVINKYDQEFKMADKADRDTHSQLVKYFPRDVVNTIYTYCNCVYALWTQRVSNCIYQLKRVFKTVNEDELYENSPVDILSAIRDEQVYSFGFCDCCQKVSYLREYTTICDIPICFQCWELKVESEELINYDSDVEMEDDLDIIWI